MLGIGSCGKAMKTIENTDICRKTLSQGRGERENHPLFISQRRKGAKNAKEDKEESSRITFLPPTYIPQPSPQHPQPRCNDPYTLIPSYPHTLSPQLSAFIQHSQSTYIPQPLPSASSAYLRAFAWKNSSKGLFSLVQLSAFIQHSQSTYIPQPLPSAPSAPLRLCVEKLEQRPQGLYSRQKPRSN